MFVASCNAKPKPELQRTFVQNYELEANRRLEFSKNEGVYHQAIKEELEIDRDRDIDIIRQKCRQASSDRESDSKLTVQELFLELELMQVKFDHPFIAPMLWEEHKGMYPSYVRLNFVGKPEIAELRELISVFDNNMFATAWITICLLEAHYYAAAPRSLYINCFEV
nr:hypothetical protein BaRGS_007470 [Batillaria attramentaria]